MFNVSRWLFDKCLRKHDHEISQSVCSYAFSRKGESFWWAAFVHIVGREHCRRSHAYYHK